MTNSIDSTCAGCGLKMPLSDTAAYDGYYNTSPECWEVYTEVLGTEFSNAVLFGQVHQLTVDTYAVQHAGGSHPDKSVGVHLTGLYLVLERGLRPMNVPRLLQDLALRVETWPHYPPPTDRGPITVFDVALAGSPEAHMHSSQAWARQLWEAWSAYHDQLTAFAREYFTFE